MRTNIILTIALLCTGFATTAQSSARELELASDAVAQAKAATAADARQTVFGIKAYHDTDGRLVVGGVTSDSLARKAVIDRLAETGVDYADSIKLMPYNRWALTRLSAASHRTAPRHAAEMATQSVMGTPLRVLETSGEWVRVQTPDGYIAYVPSSSIAIKTPEEMDAWRKSKRFIVASPYQLRAYTSPTAQGPREVVSDLVCGNIVTAVGGAVKIDNGRLHIELPDGRTGYADASALMPLEQWAAQDFNSDLILDTAYSMEGTPYLWGGTSVKALDCSGLAKVSYYANGIILMRDASQQALTGTRIEAANWRTCRPGDLLFFGNANTKKVTHVAIYDHAGRYVHSSGRVKRNSVDPEAPDYLTTPFLHATRIAGNEETAGIIRARNHPWYF